MTTTLLTAALLGRLDAADSTAVVLDVVESAAARHHVWRATRVWRIGDGAGSPLPKAAPDVVRAARDGELHADHHDLAAGIAIGDQVVAIIQVTSDDVEPATADLAALAGVAAMAVRRVSDARRLDALSGEIAMLHQVMEGVAAASTLEGVAAAALTALVTAFGWAGGVVIRDVDSDRQPSGPSPLSDHAVLAQHNAEEIGWDTIATILSGRQGLRGTLVKEVLPNGIGHALVWPLHGPTGSTLLLFGAQPTAMTGGIAEILAPIAQAGSVVRAGLDRVEHLARQRQAAEAERANRAKSDFLSRMSHELRTPLNAVLGFAQLLEMEALSDDARDSLKQISTAGTHLLGLVNEVLDIARIEAGRMSLSLEPLDLLEVVLECRDLIQPMADARHISLVVVDDGIAGRWVQADRQRVKQVLINLLSNAVKYNRDDGVVTVRAAIAGDDRLSVRVEDTGFGIPPAGLVRLFTPFERLGADGGSTEGTGLGLALSQRLAEAMGGTLTATSTVEVGTTFDLTLPRSPALQTLGFIPAPLDVDGTTDANAGATVLHIEDNLPNAKLVARILSRHAGLVVVHARTGGQAIATAEASPPHLILLDLDLPDMHGHDVITKLRANPITRAVPVVVVSADTSTRQIRRLRNAGAVGYLPKPFNLPDLLAAVDRGLADPDRSGLVAGPSSVVQHLDRRCSHAAE